MVNAISFLNVNIKDPYALKGPDAQMGINNIQDKNFPNTMDQDFGYMQPKKHGAELPKEDVEIIDTALDMDSLDAMLKLQQEEQILK